MNFYDWVKSPEAEEYRKRREAGEKGNPDNPYEILNRISQRLD